MRKALLPRDDIHRQYVSRKEGKGLTCIKDCVDATIEGLQEYSKKKKKSNYKSQQQE